MSTGAEEPVETEIRANATALDRELAWLADTLRARLARRFGPASDGESSQASAPPRLAPDGSALGRFVAEAKLAPDERLVLALALAPHLRPHLLDLFFVRDPNTERGFTEFGGGRARSHGGFLPTGETAAFLVAGDDLTARIALLQLFSPEHVFHREGLIRLEHETPGEPTLSGALVLSEDALARFTRGGRPKPVFSAAFPARRITTALDWEDLVLGPEVMAEIDIIRGWLEHRDAILGDWDLGRVLTPGYCSLFYGPPGAGKTLTAALIGKSAGKDVYRVDLSAVVSKYIGETEKNLSQVFDRAEHGGWILFFDEADALFGKRTGTASAHDRYANQEVAYLLQRIEEFRGHVILASNLKSNIDEAFARRFQSMVHFPMPDADQRLRLWRGVLRRQDRLAGDVSLETLAERYELSGGGIANVARFAAISATRAGRTRMSAADLTQGVLKEFRKEGRTL
jgi:hypothetical protein